MLCQTNLNSLKMLQNAKFYLLKMKFALFVQFLYVVTISFLHFFIFSRDSDLTTSVVRPLVSQLVSE